MNNNQLSSGPDAEAGAQDRLTALFSGMVLQQTQTALMLLGQVPDPQTKRTVVDLEAAQVFIDQLEMLEIKTRGNLTPQEEALLKQSLMTARMAFVEAVERAEAPQPAQAQPAAASISSGAAESRTPAEAQSGQTDSDHESRRKFFKKY